MVLHRVVKGLMIGSLSLMAVSCWKQESLPPAQALRAELAEEPKQVAVRTRPFDTQVNGVDYRVRPLYSYDLHGLVVSLHFADTWWDYAHREWNDHMNLVDLCVVWGGNATSGAYRDISFSNTQWECHYRGSHEAWQAFDAAGVSNNHLITDDPGVAKALRGVRVGDQVRVRGYLAEYETFGKDGRPAGKRGTSTVRTDSGPNACETIYVESLDILTATNRAWRTAFKVALGILALSAVGWMFLPARFDD